MGHHNKIGTGTMIFDERGKLKEVLYEFFKVHDPLQAVTTILLDTLQYILTQPRREGVQREQQYVI